MNTPSAQNLTFFPNFSETTDSPRDSRCTSVNTEPQLSVPGSKHYYVRRFLFKYLTSSPAFSAHTQTHTETRKGGSHIQSTLTQVLYTQYTVRFSAPPSDSFVVRARVALVNNNIITIRTPVIVPVDFDRVRLIDHHSFIFHSHAHACYLHVYT